jgi:phosphoethanolamine N-methyltransferase
MNAMNTLDAGQYTLDEIRKYEAVYGRNFVSPGGEATTRALLKLVTLQPNMLVLDVGCGLGGAAFVLASSFGLRVHGIDLSRNMLQLAQERYQQAQQTYAGPLAVSFEHADILHYDCPASYDLVHSRDVFLHIHDKARLLAAIMRSLRPGGHLLFTDYLCRAGEQSAEFAAYIHSRGYDLHSLADYHQLLVAAGFIVTLAEDRTAEFIAILERELAGLETTQLSPAERSALAQSWQGKIHRARAGEQRWGVFVAQKPA